MDGEPEMLDDPAAIVANMALAHEMIMTDNFQLTHVTELKDDSLVKNVRNIVHQAFWDLLEKDIAADPPQYGNAMKLLKEMKQLILEITPLKHEKLITEIKEVLDEDLIKQEVDHGVFNLHNCAMFIINVLGKLCAPIRDGKVKELKTETNLVPLLRGIFELLDLMKVDMANFEIQKIKPIVMKQAVQYERTKFGEYLEQNPNGLDNTKIWIKKAFDVVKSLQVSGSPTRNIRNVIITHAYLSLINNEGEKVYPETLVLDRERIEVVASSYQKFVYVASLLAAYKTYAGDHLTTDAVYMEQLKDTIFVLLEGVIEYEIKPCTFNSNWMDKCLNHTFISGYEKAQENVIEQLLAETDKQMEVRGLAKKSDDKKEFFKGQIKALLEPDNQLVKLIKSRLRDYLLLSFASETQVPPTSSVLLPIAKEMKQVTDVFVRVIRHNRAVYHEYYNNILNEFFSVTQSEQSGDTNQPSRKDVEKQPVENGHIVEDGEKLKENERS